jgi:hypothetical protein
MLARVRAQTAPAPPFDNGAQTAPAPVFQGFQAFFGVSHMVEYTFAL